MNVLIPRGEEDEVWECFLFDSRFRPFPNSKCVYRAWEEKITTLPLVFSINYINSQKNSKKFIKTLEN
jgi:hypothetical protein